MLAALDCSESARVVEDDGAHDFDDAPVTSVDLVARMSMARMREVDARERAAREEDFAAMCR